MIKSWRSGAALVAVVAATATIVPMSLQPATNPAQAAADPMAVRPATPDRTSALEARRVGSVATPHLDWRPCHESARCATVKLPLDYDRPRSATIDVRLLKVAAR